MWEWTRHKLNARSKLFKWFSWNHLENQLQSQHFLLRLYSVKLPKFSALAWNHSAVDLATTFSIDPPKTNKGESNFAFLVWPVIPTQNCHGSKAYILVLSPGYGLEWLLYRFSSFFGGNDCMMWHCHLRTLQQCAAPHLHRIWFHFEISFPSVYWDPVNFVER